MGIARKSYLDDPAAVYIRTMLLGMFPNMDAIRKSLAEREVMVAPDVEEMMPHIRISPVNRLVRVTFVTVAGLGFVRSGATQKDLYARARGRGLKLATAELALLLRLHYDEQELGEWVHVAMEPLVKPDGSTRILGLGCRSVKDKKKCLMIGASDGRPEHLWAANRVVAFVHSEESENEAPA